jgi:hypothetical protein
VLEHLGFINDDPNGIYHAALTATQLTERIGKILVQHLDVIDKIVGLATVVEDILEAPYCMVFELDFLSLDLGLVE